MFVVCCLAFCFAQSSQRSKERKVNKEKLSGSGFAGLMDFRILDFRKSQPFERIERIEPFEHVNPPKHEGFF
jgi:cyclopropane fatty-acyl-phospholipid synthase-like methyltransferase